MITTIQVNATQFEVDTGANDRFWRNVSSGRWEPETFAIFDRHITPETLFVDVGAWIGPTLLYAAQIARTSVAFEPDPVAIKALRRNVKLNAGTDWQKSITVFNAGVNADGKPFVLGGEKGGGNSVSSALFPDRENSWTVKAERLPDVLEKFGSPDQPTFLKIDIEGGEYALIPTLADILARPNVTTYLSCHSGFLRRSLRQSSEKDTNWKLAYHAAHEALLNALPWSRNVESATGEPLARDALQKRLAETREFPSELLIF